MRFKEGQEVVCIVKGQDKYWLDEITGNFELGPAYNEIVTVTGYDPDASPDAIYLKEYPPKDPTASYYEKFFEPLIDISELVEETLSVEA